jgi:Ni/Co efflux regulator RcnB
VQPPPPGTQQLGGWNRGAQGGNLNVAGQSWRQQHRGWDRSAVWRRNRDWWRNDTAFRTFRGPRPGFWFVPTFGYVSVPLIYQRHDWRAGDYLPEFFWRYEVVNYWRFGLPAPPYGCAWIWVNNDVALVDLDSGFIIDMVYDVW